MCLFLFAKLAWNSFVVHNMVAVSLVASYSCFPCILKGGDVALYNAYITVVHLVSCPARTRLLARNGLVNEVEFLGLIPQKW